MLRKRRKAVHYMEINFIKDAKNEYIVKGSYIKNKKDNTINGPVSKILEENTIMKRITFITAQKIQRWLNHLHPCVACQL